MKILLCLVLMAALLGGCGDGEASKDILVTLRRTQGAVVEESSQRIASGDNAAFYITLEEGYTLTGVDYAGAYTITRSGGGYVLELEQVRYPGCIDLAVSRQVRELTFYPNGGEGEAVAVPRNLEFHLRPNTAPALFSRPGYTLIRWNTQPDGSGTSVGLGSRITLPESGELSLYAQWLPWSPGADFQMDGGRILAYTGGAELVVIPEVIGGVAVTEIAPGAFRGAEAAHIVLPKTMETVEAGAFRDCALTELTVFDNIQYLPSDAFQGCDGLRTLHINAQQPPFGSHYRRESVLADKLDLLILSRGQRKMVCYGGCSMWYNLEGSLLQEALAGEYRVINTAINGVINSAVQMQIITAYLEPGDIFFHTPELSSDTQLMAQVGFGENDRKLWCGLEYNYDLLEAVDLRDFPGLLDSYQLWRSRKGQTGDYDESYRDEAGRIYFDGQTGSIPFQRLEGEAELLDGVDLDPRRLSRENLERLGDYYRRITDRGVRVYVGAACINLDEIPQNQQGTVDDLEQILARYLQELENVTWISRQRDYLYRSEDFFDTNYHLLSHVAQRNTGKWIRDLRTQMTADGLWPEPDQ